MKRQYSSDSWNTTLLGICFFLAVLFFHWRENRQEEVIVNIKTQSDGCEQRVRKLEETVAEAVAKSQQVKPEPKKVKAKPKHKRISQDIANGRQLPKEN